MSSSSVEDGGKGQGVGAKGAGGSLLDAPSMRSNSGRDASHYSSHTGFSLLPDAPLLPIGAGAPLSSRRGHLPQVHETDVLEQEFQHVFEDKRKSMQSERWLGHQQPGALGERQHVPSMGQPSGVHGQHAGMDLLAGGLEFQHRNQQHLWPSSDNNPFIQQQAGLQAGGHQQQQGQAGAGQGQSARRQAAGGSGSPPARTMADLMLEMGVDAGAFQRHLQSMEQPLARTSHNFVYSDTITGYEELLAPGAQLRQRAQDPAQLPGQQLSRQEVPDLALEDIWSDAFPPDVIDMEPLPAQFECGLQNAAPVDLRLSSLEREALASFGLRDSPTRYQLLPDQRQLHGDVTLLGHGPCSSAPPHQQRPQLGMSLEHGPSHSLPGEAAGAALASLEQGPQQELQHQQVARASPQAGAGALAGPGVAAGASPLAGLGPLGGASMAVGPAAHEQQLTLAPPQADVRGPQTEPRVSSRSPLRGEGQGQPEVQAALPGRKQQQAVADREPGNSHGAVLQLGEAAEGSDGDDVTGAAKPPADEQTGQPSGTTSGGRRQLPILKLKRGRSGRRPPPTRQPPALKSATATPSMSQAEAPSQTGLPEQSEATPPAEGGAEQTPTGSTAAPETSGRSGAVRRGVLSPGGARSAADVGGARRLLRSSMSRSTGTGSKLTGASETCAAGQVPEGGDQLTSRRAAKRRPDVELDLDTILTEGFPPVAGSIEDLEREERAPQERGGSQGRQKGRKARSFMSAPLQAQPAMSGRSRGKRPRPCQSERPDGPLPRQDRDNLDRGRSLPGTGETSLLSGDEGMTGDEGEDVDDRVKKRRLSNRDSARRTRMRKARELDAFREQLGEATKLITGLQDKVAKLTNANKLLAMGVPQISQSYREVTAENQSLRAQVQVLERSMARMCHQQQQGDALASLALQLGGSHIAAMLAGQGAAGATHEGLQGASGTAVGPAKEIGVNSDSTSSAASSGMLCQPIAQPTQQTVQAQAQAQAQAGGGPGPQQQPHGQQQLGPAAAAAAGEAAGQQQQQLPQEAVAQEPTDPLAALAAQLAGKSSANATLWGTLQQASQAQQLPRAAMAETAARGSMMPQQQQQQARPSVRQQVVRQQTTAPMGVGGLGGVGPQHQQQAGAGAGTSDHLIQLLAHHHQQEQQPTMMQGSPGPVPAQLLALLVQQQRLQQLGQTPQHQLGTAAAAGGRIMDTSAQKSQEDLALERLAAQLEQCRKTTAQQAGAAK